MRLFLTAAVVLIALLTGRASAQQESALEVYNGTLYPLPDGEKAGKPIVMVPPKYPAGTERSKDGFVDFEFTLVPDGSVQQPRVIQEQPANYGFAEEAAKVFVLWKFPPKFKDGQPVSARVHYRMKFRLAR